MPPVKSRGVVRALRVGTVDRNNELVIGAKNSKF